MKKLPPIPESMQASAIEAIKEVAAELRAENPHLGPARHAATVLIDPDTKIPIAGSSFTAKPGEASGSTGWTRAYADGWERTFGRN